MNFTIKHLKRPHPILRSTFPDDGVFPYHWTYPKQVKRFWEHLTPATKAIVALCDCLDCAEYADPRIIGFLRYQNGTELGTWVDPNRRLEGVAMALWDEMVRVENTKKLHCTIVSKDGKAFLKKLRKRFPSVQWSVKDKS